MGSPSKPRSSAAAATRPPLSPRGRGSKPAPNVDEDELIRVFADNVRSTRKARGFSQEELADLADLDRTYISSLERSRRNVGIRNIQRIALALEVEAFTLLLPLTP